MRFVFRVLILGEPNSTYEYVVRAFQSLGEKEIKYYYYEWYKETKVLEDVCDLEINVISDTISADYDAIFPTIDGIIYFINPKNLQEFELFEMQMPIINTVKRNIPIILVFYDKSGILPITNEELLESAWRTYPDYESFINLSPNEFHQAIECLCLAMIAGDAPLNIENAWMRFPIFIELANKYFTLKQYFYAAQAMKKAALISEIYNNNDFYVYYEQTAFLFSQANLFLEASKILSKFDQKKGIDFKRLYHMAMIKEGNFLFNKEEYESAGIQYEIAGQWASIELEDRKLVNESFKLAVNSWISACKVEKAFKILERMPHNEVEFVLKEISSKIFDAIDYLVSEDNLEGAKDQLYYSILVYQKEGIFEVLDKFALKLVDILSISFEQKINEKDLYLAKKIYDEIENLWDNFKIEKKNLDKLLETLITLFLDEYNFGQSTILINKLSSLDLKKELTERSLKVEEKTKRIKKKEIEENVRKGVKVLESFVNDEQNLIVEMNKRVIEESDKYIKENDFAKAAKIIKNQSIFLKNIGKEDIGDQILAKSLDILCDGLAFETFFKFHKDLSEAFKKTYLLRIYPKFVEKLKEFKSEKDFNKKDKIFEITIKTFREALLYDESKEISKLFIKEIKKEALKIVNIENNIIGIEKATELIKKINSIISAYFEDFAVNFDKIYKKIAEIYINMEDFYSAQAYNDKIENKEFKSEIHQKLGKLELKKTSIQTKKVEKTLIGESLKEKLSFIKKKGSDMSRDKDDELKQRKALQSTYLNEAIVFLKNKNYDEAIQSYKNSILKLSQIKKYNLAGVSFAIACLLLLYKNRTNEMIALLTDVKKQLSSSEKLFSETFPVILIEYIIDMKKVQEESNLEEALSYFEYLPLFEEELIVLYDNLGKKFEKKEEKQETKFDSQKLTEIRSNVINIAKGIKIEKQEIAKRKIMQKDYWNDALNSLSNKDYNNAYLKYSDAITKLVNKNFNQQAALALILSTIIQINELNLNSAKKSFENNLKMLKKLESKLEILPEIQIMDYLFLANEHKINEIIELILNNFLEKLNLFETEANYLKSILGEKISLTQTEKEQKIEVDVKKSKTFIEMDNKFDKLKQKQRDLKEDLKSMLNKRKVMKKRMYDEILTMINNNLFEEASNGYLKNAEQLLKRKDFENCSFHILLTGLSALKSKQPLDIVKNKIKEFLETLGLNKKLIEETFYVSLIFFIFEAKKFNMDEFLQKGEELLELLPLFDEEKKLVSLKK